MIQRVVLIFHLFIQKKIVTITDEGETQGEKVAERPKSKVKDSEL